MKSSKLFLALLSCLTVFIAVLSLPITTQAAAATSLTINGSAPPDNNDVFGDGSGATFDSQTGTLTITNDTTFNSATQGDFIQANGDLTINCSGNPVITYNGQAPVFYGNNNSALTIIGNLTVATSTNAPVFSQCTDVTINGNLTVTSTRAGGNSNGALYLSGVANITGDITLSGFNGGIQGATDVTITGNVNITNSNGTGRGIGAYQNIVISGGTSSTISTNQGSALWTQNGSISISDKFVANNAGDTTITSGGDMTIDGEVTAVSTTVSGAIRSGGTLTIVSGPVDAHNMNNSNSAAAILGSGGISYPTTHEISSPTSGKLNTASTYVAEADGTTFAHDVVISLRQFAITVTNDGNGIGSASASTGISGDSITLTATPASGYQFKEWQVVSGGVTITNDSFTIGTSDVEVKAIFELIPVATTYKVTVTNDGNGSASASKSSGATGDAVTLTATPSTGYKFKEWQVVSGGITVSNDSFTIGSTDVEVKAVFEKDTTNTNNTNSGTTNNTTTNSGTNNTSNTSNSNSSSSSSSSSSSGSSSSSSSSADTVAAKDTVPKTGDNNALPALFVIALSSMLGMAAFGLNLKKNK